MTCDPMLRTIYCVLDGLDECDKASLEVLLRRFKALFSKNSSDTPSCRLNLIAVSRDLPDIIPELLSGFPRIRLDHDADIEVNQDITRFIDAKLNDIFSVKKYPQSTCVRVKNIFRERAQGTFLWIGIAAKTLEEYSAIEYEEALERLPPGLNELYTRMLRGIKVNHRQVAARILRWVVMVVRPLTLSELSAIIGPTVEPPFGFTREDVTKNQVSYCGYFLTIEGCEVNLIHQSAKDYLLSGDHDSTPELRDFRMDEKAGNHEIASNCFQYLQDNLLPSGGDMDPTRENSHLEAFPLLSYATLYWHVHARTLPSSDDIFDLSRPFYCKNSRIRELWLKIYHDLWVKTYFDHGKVSYFRFPNSSKPLHIASHFGILPLAEKLLTRGGAMDMVKRLHSINEKDITGMTALHYAAMDGHLAIARFLLEMGADPNANDQFGRTVLHVEAIYGREGVVRLLLEKGAGINTKDEDDMTALHLAVSFRNEGAARLLLKQGADINAKGHRNETALHNAAMFGNEGLVRLLLEKGAEINAKDEEDQTALYWAAQNRHDGAVRLLLDMGADINADHSGLARALHHVAESGNEALVRLLLKMGADVNVKDKWGKTALHMTADSGHEGLVRLLLEKGADINAKNKDGTTALHNAALFGHERVVRLLLDMGADVNAKNKDGTTALHNAAQSGNERVVRLLLDMGADINAQDQFRKTTALHVAAKYGREGVVRLLLEMGVDINAKDRYGWTALDYASREGSEEVVQLLLGKDCESDYVDCESDYAAPSLDEDQSSEWDIFTAESVSVASLRADSARREFG